MASLASTLYADAANTGNVCVRRAVLLPSQVSVAALLSSPNVAWFWAASTNAAAPAEPAVTANAILDVAPAAAQAMHRHGVFVRQELLRRLGVGGSPLLASLMLESTA